MAKKSTGNMKGKRLTEQEAINLLKDQNISLVSFLHSQNVSQIAELLGRSLITLFPALDMNTIVVGGLLHDIGRQRRSNANHWLEGAKWLREQGFYEGYANIALRHTRHWDENPDHQPRTPEELIVCWADKAVKGIYLAKVQEALIHMLLKVKGIKVVTQELNDIFSKVIYELEKNEEKRRLHHL